MKKLLALSITLTMCWCMGCAPREHLSRDDISPWDESIANLTNPKTTYRAF
ncbi:MAG: hypothetical protein OXU23_19710 [Candidatus Poribacteria bacterium]|nr:hypothetical protein [Candidatus Poribacteria bacterium]